MRLAATILLFYLLPDASAQSDFYDQLSAGALELTKQQVTYYPGYFSIPYPGGDLPADKGVCTDVIIRAYRKLGIDLQKEVHEDMKTSFLSYPQLWGLSRPDPNIDHRRVPNLMTFFSRKGKTLPVTNNPEDYQPGDIVCWDLGGGVRHIGIVIFLKSPAAERYQVVHNIGNGQVAEDCLFRFRIIGHFQYNK